MAVEARRGCGYRRIGRLYLVCDGIGFSCDRLPLPIEPCDTCGEQPRFNRGISGIRPDVLWGGHHPCEDKRLATFCATCTPPTAGFLMWVGDDYTVESVNAEAATLGISKRIPAIPKDLELGVDWVYLAKLKIIPNGAQQWLPGQTDERAGYGPGVFTTFRPTRIEKIVSDLTPAAELDSLREQIITPVVVPHDDPDHAARRSLRTSRADRTDTNGSGRS